MLRATCRVLSAIPDAKVGKLARTTPLPRSRRLRPPFSIFGSPSSAWKDFYRAQIHVQQQRQRRSPFVQQQYARFVRSHPHIVHVGLTDRRYPPFPTPSSSAIPAFSYLKDRLQLRNDPQAVARRNSLLRSRQRVLPFEELACPRARRRRPPANHHLVGRFHPPMDSRRMTSPRRLTYPKSLVVPSIQRFSRRRHL